MTNIRQQKVDEILSTPPKWPLYGDPASHDPWPLIYGEPMNDTDLTAMLTHAHQDAQHTGHCHWCHMTPILDYHLIIGYTHAKLCELSSLVSREEE